MAHHRHCALRCTAAVIHVASADVWQMERADDPELGRLNLMVSIAGHFFNQGRDIDNEHYLL